MQAEILNHSDLTPKQLFRLIHKQQLLFAGNCKLKIYGLLSCASGKRMKKEKRVFFTTENQALQAGYRPCGVCRRQAYDRWKTGQKYRIQE